MVSMIIGLYDRGLTIFDASKHFVKEINPRISTLFYSFILNKYRAFSVAVLHLYRETKEKKNFIHDGL